MYSEIIVVLLVYSGLITYFLIPFRNGMRAMNEQESHIKCAQTFKEHLTQMIFHKKAILAVVVLIFALYYIWSLYAGIEYRVNEHSGYAPISMKVNAIYSMISLFLYTVGLVFVLVYVKARKTMR